MAFDGAGQNPGLEIWRIEDFEAVPLDPAKYGTFHEGDSYIVLKTTTKKSGGLSWQLHFWLGEKTSQDEAGTAAIKTVELDDQLGGSPVQYREVQEHESNLFTSYFKKGIKYLPGGVKSGFTHVDPDEVEKRLFQVKGKRNIKAKQVALDPAVLNTNDCWILDGGKGHTIFVYMPPGASKMENFKGTQVANEIRDEDHAGNATVEIIDELNELFFAELGAEIQEISGGDDGLDDQQVDDEAGVKLYKVSDADGDLEITEIEDRPLRQDMLDDQVGGVVVSGSGSRVDHPLFGLVHQHGLLTFLAILIFMASVAPGLMCSLSRSFLPGHRWSSKFILNLFHLSSGTDKSLMRPSYFIQDCFVLNTGRVSGVFAWIGKEATKEEKAKVMEVSEKFLAKEGLPKWTPVRRIVQGTETTMFKQFFQVWKEPSDTPYIVGLGRIYPEEQVAEWDVADLHTENRIRLLTRAGGRAIGFCPDDGTGQKEIFRIENFELVPVDPELYGKLFGGDSYVIKYTYNDPKTGNEAYIIYFWQVSNLFSF